MGVELKIDLSKGKYLIVDRAIPAVESLFVQETMRGNCALNEANIALFRYVYRVI